MQVDSLWTSKERIELIGWFKKIIEFSLEKVDFKFIFYKLSLITLSIKTSEKMVKEENKLTLHTKLSKHIPFKTPYT